MGIFDFFHRQEPESTVCYPKHYVDAITKSRDDAIAAANRWRADYMTVYKSVRDANKGIRRLRRKLDKLTKENAAKTETNVNLSELQERCAEREKQNREEPARKKWSMAR